MRALVIVNPGSGDGEPDALLAAARRSGHETHVLSEGEDLEAIARGASVDALAMAGGDGSLAVVASVAIERDLPFACIPFGTRNHFARDLGLDRDDPVAALDALAGGDERRVDVGRANDRLFLNNVSLGVYARLVHRREKHRRRRDAFARLRALGALLTHHESVGLTVDGESLDAPVVLVANNEYELDMLSVGERSQLDAGLLYLYAPCGLLRSAWEERPGAQFTIDARAGRLHAAIDGEPDELETPIEFRIESRALRVLVPRRPVGE